MRHFKTYEFIYKFMYMKNIVKSYLKSCVSRFQMTHRCGSDTGSQAHCGMQVTSCVFVTSRQSLAGELTRPCNGASESLNLELPKGYQLLATRDHDQQMGGPYLYIFSQ